MLVRSRLRRGPFPRGVMAAAMFGCTMLAVTLPRPALAQFDFFDRGEASVQDVYDAIADHGFRLAGPLMRNGSVYVADVLDRGQRRERLIIAARNARIVQRFYVDDTSRYGAQIQGGAVPPRSRTARNSDDSDNFFSRLTRGWDDEAPPRPPAAIDNGAPDEAIAPPRPTQRRTVRQRPTDIEPRLATRRDDAPISTAPLPAPAPTPTAVSPAPAKAAPPQPAPVAAVAPTPPAAPAAPVPAASNTRPVVVVTDPLRIPGEKPRETPKAPAETASAAVKPAVPPKPAAKPADVLVAPLE